MNAPSQRVPVIELADPETIEMLRHKTPAEKLEMAAGMWRSARAMLLNLVRSEHPDWSDEQVAAEVARRMSHGAK